MRSPIFHQIFRWLSTFVEMKKGSGIEGNPGFIKPFRNIYNDIFPSLFLLLESMVVYIVLAKPAVNSFAVQKTNLSIGPVVLMDPNMVFEMNLQSDTHIDIHPPQCTHYLPQLVK